MPVVAAACRTCFALLIPYRVLVTERTRPTKFARTLEEQTFSLLVHVFVVVLLAKVRYLILELTTIEENVRLRCLSPLNTQPKSQTP